MKILRLPFSAPRFIEHEVCGSQEKFYQCSTRVLCKLRTLAGPVLKAFGDLFSDKRNDYSTRNTKTSQEGALQEVLEVNASSADVLKMRADQRKEAIQNLIAGVASDDSMNTLAEIVMDSMRECYQGEASPEDTRRFLRETPAEAFLDMLTGVAKAHDKLFSPFLGRVKEAAGTLKEALAAKMSDLSGKEPEEGSATQNQTSGSA